MEVADPRIGTSYGSYLLERRLGEGGMGTVYVGVHSRTGRRYAVKLLHPETPESRLERQALARFRREARALSGLRHENVVAIHDFDVTERGEPYLVMDLLDGEPLSSRIERSGGLSWPEALRYFGQLASALDAVHQVGVIHRDVKPSNVLIARIPGGDERAVLLDFGVAKQLVSETSTVTSPETALGTPAYMAPEQARGQRVDPRTDVYALGIVLYEMVAGRPPFVGPTPTAVIAQTLVDPPPPLTSMTTSKLPVGIDEVIARALAKDPVDRWGDAHELSEAIDALAPMVPRRASLPETRVLTAGRNAQLGARRWPWIAAAAVAVAAAFGVFWLTRDEPPAPRAASAPAVQPVPVAMPEEALEPLARPPAVDVEEPVVAEASAPARPSPSAARPVARRAPVAAPLASAPSASSEPVPPARASTDPVTQARAAAARRQWRECVAAIASQPTIERNALDVFLICADRARDRSALERGCREIERLLLFEHAWHQRCQVEILAGGRRPSTSPRTSPAPAPSNLSGDDRLEHDAQELRQRADFAGCARVLESIQRSYPGLMMRLDCAELSGDRALLRRACRTYIDARIPAQSRFNAICEDVLRAAAGNP